MPCSPSSLATVGVEVGGVTEDDCMYKHMHQSTMNGPDNCLGMSRLLQGFAGALNP
jgi:hypothetical protein